MSDAPFPDAPRVDAHEKVRGAVVYGSDTARSHVLHAALAVATIGKGRITSLDTLAASSIPGVELILTHENFGHVKSAGFLMAGGHAFQSFQPMLSSVIAYRGQPIALIVADRLETATEAAALVQAAYSIEPIRVTLDAPGAQAIDEADTPLNKRFPEITAGDADRAFAAAPIKIDVCFTTAPQHHNPMELIATVAEWKDGKLIVHESTQNAEGLRHGLVAALGLTPDRVEVISAYIGGGFGQKYAMQMQTVLVAVAARRLGRAVKLVVPRAQIFHDSSFRPATRHRVRLGGDRSGKMLAAIHEVDAQTSRYDLFPALYAETSSRLYGIKHFRGRERFVRNDVQTPGYMRAPYEHAACYVLECCVDELAYGLGRDPVALRLANDTRTDPISKLPFSSRHVGECLRRGAQRFGWSKRIMTPQSMRADDGSCIGWGVAIGAYPCFIVPTVARLRVTLEGGVFISIGTHEMGQGIRTSLATIVAHKLGVPAASVVAVIGDTRATPQHMTAGSWGTASAIPAANQAADELLEALAKLIRGGASGRTPAEILKAAGRASLEVEVRTKAPGQADNVYAQIAAGQLVAAGPVYPEFVSFSYSAHFVEVCVEPTTRHLRIPRVVSVVDCGRVISPRTAVSQVRGGVVWGIGAALREASEVDPRYGGFLNADLAEYLVPVNADIGCIEVDFIDEPDFKFNSAGVKGLGEISMVGVAPAIANAVYHATGRRVRNLPIRIEDLL
jgi:xanthine dehydrogenase YagR molybdenum-binding subunit